MTPPRREKPVPPLLVLTEDDCGALFGRGETWFRERAPEFEAQGFPKIDPLLDGRNACQVEQWFMDRKPGAGAPASDDELDKRLEAMSHG